MNSDGTSDDKYYLVIQAILYDNGEFLRELLLEDPEAVNLEDTEGHTPFFHAIVRGSVNCARVLLEKSDYDVNVPMEENTGRTPLLIASCSGDSQMVEMLLEHLQLGDTDLFRCDSGGYTALQLAQINGHSRVAELLMNHIEKESTFVAEKRAELLSLCAENDSGDAISNFLRELPARLRFTLGVLRACDYGNSKSVEALLTVGNHCIVLVSNGDTVLHCAVASQDPSTVSLILNAFPRLMCQANDDKALPLHWAAQCGNLVVLKCLLEHLFSRTDLKLFVKGNEWTYEFICDLNATDSECRTPLWLAVANGHLTLVNYMLAYKVAEVRDGETAKQSTPDSACPFILDTYANNGRTPLMMAASAGNEAILRSLIGHGADVNLPLAITDEELAELESSTEMKCNAGSGALFEATTHGHAEIVHLLLSYGAVDYENRALFEAQKQGKACHRVIPQFLARLTTLDNEYRIVKSPIDAEHNGTIATLLASVYPSRGCQLKWQNAGIEKVEFEWLASACSFSNPKLRHHSKLALAAITRIDLSNNLLQLLPPILFQLPSLRILNASANCIRKIEFPSKVQSSLFLEILSLAGNYLEELPKQLFSAEHFPHLRKLDVAGNGIQMLPYALWTAPSLAELNARDNEISGFEGPQQARQTARSSRQEFGRLKAMGRHGRRQQPHNADSAVSLGRPSSEVQGPPSDEIASVWTPNSGIESDVVRLNRWQKEISLSNVDDDDRFDDEIEASIRREPEGDEKAKFSGSHLRILNLSGNKLKVVPDILACVCPHLAKLDLSMNELSTLGSAHLLPTSLRHLNAAKNQLAELFSTRLENSMPSSSCFSPQIPNAGSARGREVNYEAISRHSRSRSKSVARNQRSLSVARILKGEAGADAQDTCVHRLHCRLESLKSLNLSHNQLTSITFLIPTLESSHPATPVWERFNWRENAQQMKSYLLFPALTSLDLSHNGLRTLSPAVSLHNYLAILNLAHNARLETLPTELGILDKLWNIGLAGCSGLKEPLSGLVSNEGYRTGDVLNALRCQLENLKPYSKLKLMLVGRNGVGKTTLLQRLSAEGRVMKGVAQSKSWSRRMGHQSKSPTRYSAPSTGTSKGGGSTANTKQGVEGAAGTAKFEYPVDVWEWAYEPSKKSSSSIKRSSAPGANEAAQSYQGPLTFRVWNFSGLQEDTHAVQQYFYTRRSLFLLLWKLTEGEIALDNEIHDWLVRIQACAQNATVLIVATHADFVKEHASKYPPGYLEELDGKIYERYVNTTDAEKKGLPRVVGSIYINANSREDVKSLCDLVYHVAISIPSFGRRGKMLHSVPSLFLALEKIAVRVTDELRSKGEEPIVRFDDFLILATTHILEEQGKPFRDEEEFRHACLFLHDNGVIVYFDDGFLRDYVFLDPQWLCDILKMAVSTPLKLVAGRGHAALSTMVDLYATLKSLRPLEGQRCLTNKLDKGAGQLQLFRSCLLNLLRKHELALPISTRMLILPPLLPDEYSLRAHYPGANVMVPCKGFLKWRLRMAETIASSPSPSPVRQYLQQRKLARTLAYHYSIDEFLGTSKPHAETSFDKADVASYKGPNLARHNICPRRSPKAEYSLPATLRICKAPACDSHDVLRRIYLMHYIPPGFWPRLLTKLLDDGKLALNAQSLLLVSCVDSNGAKENSKPQFSSLNASPLDGDELLEELSYAMAPHLGVQQSHPEGKTTEGYQPIEDMISDSDEVAETSFTSSQHPESEEGCQLPTTQSDLRSPECCEKEPLYTHVEAADTGITTPAAMEWQIWQTGMELRLWGVCLISIKQLLPLASNMDVNYHEYALKRRSDSDPASPWQNAGFSHNGENNNNSIVEVAIARMEMLFDREGVAYKLEVDDAISARVLATIVETIDDLLEDWFPALGTRFVHTSEGRLLVERLVPCDGCVGEVQLPSSLQHATIARGSVKELHLFGVEECIEAARLSCSTKGSSCPRHGVIDLERVAPDLVFADLTSELRVESTCIYRRKIMGQGAFGFVFSGLIKRSSGAYTEVALKVLEPVERLQQSSASSMKGSYAEKQATAEMEAALCAFSLKWKNGARENAARSYSLARQELTMLAGIRHQHIPALLGFSTCPTTLVFELAPFGSLDSILQKYKSSEAKLDAATIQQTCLQIAMALEFLHTVQQIIYRDLKSMNVLCWKFPIPTPRLTYPVGEVHVKLSDYGISRACHPSGMCKGYGGTEGFMAPEIVRYNGEQEYTAQVDSYSFGMLIYELLTLRQPHDGRDQSIQMKDFISEGRRPHISDRELLYPTNMLDLMVVCWSETPEGRPTSSQLVRICSAPEFHNLLDLAVLPSIADDKGTSETPIAWVQTNHMALAETWNNGALWISQNEGEILSLTCSPYGWTRQEVMKLQLRGGEANLAKITAMCQVEKNIWIGYSAGHVELYRIATLDEPIETTEQGELDLEKRRVLSIVYMAGRKLVAISKSHTVALYRLGNVDREPRILLSLQHLPQNRVYSTMFLPIERDWQIWTGHSYGRVIVHHLTSSCDRLIYSATLRHRPMGKRGEDLSIGNGATERVEFLAASTLYPSLCWSAMSGGSELFVWRESRLSQSIDCGRLLPTTGLTSVATQGESISQAVSIWKLAVQQVPTKASKVASTAEYTSKERLLIGMNNGTVIILDAPDMKPLVIFRPFFSPIEHIVVGSPTTWTDNLSFEQGDVAQVPVCHQSRSILDTVAQVPKSIEQTGTMLLTSIPKLQTSVDSGEAGLQNGLAEISQEWANSAEPSFVVIGSGYRCLLECIDTTFSQAVDNRRCALFIRNAW